MSEESAIRDIAILVSHPATGTVQNRELLYAIRDCAQKGIVRINAELVAAQKAEIEDLRFRATLLEKGE